MKAIQNNKTLQQLLLIAYIIFVLIVCIPLDPMEMTSPISGAIRLARPLVIVSLTLTMFHEKTDISRFDYILLFLGIIIYCTTVFFKANTAIFWTTATKMIGVSLLVALLIRSQAVLLIFTFSRLLGLYTIINFFVYILMPDGLYINVMGYPAHFFGYDNLSMGPLIAACGFSIFHDVSIKNKVSWFSWIIVACSAYYIISQAIGAGLIVLVLCFCCFVASFISAVDLLTFNKLTLSALTANIIILIPGSRVALSFIYELVGKDPSINGRGNIWEIANQLFLESPLIGHGCFFGENIIALTKNWAAWHWHNMYMQILLEGGLFALAVFLFLIFYAGNANGVNNKPKAIRVLYVTAFLYLAVFIVDMFQNLFILAIVSLSFIYHIQTISDQYENLRNKGADDLILKLT